VQPPKEPDPPTVGGMIQGYRLAGKGFPPKAQGHVSQPVQLKSKAKIQTDGMGSELYRLLCRWRRLWVKSGHCISRRSCPLYLRKRTSL